jgi:hypothetical protein
MPVVAADRSLLVSVGVYGRLLMTCQASGEGSSGWGCEHGKNDWHLPRFYFLVFFFWVGASSFFEPLQLTSTRRAIKSIILHLSELVGSRRHGISAQVVKGVEPGGEQNTIIQFLHIM